MTAPTSPPSLTVPVDADVLAETRTFNAALERLLASQPSLHTVPLPVARRVRREGGGIFPPPVFLPQARDVSIRGRGGDIRLRVLAPPREAKGVYFHIHGGGWALGGADMQDPLLLALVEATDLCVVSVDYRLAPEHPHPAGADDCEDAARWLIERGGAELGVPSRFSLGGESAGAHLSVVTLLRLRDGHGITGIFRAANLVYGAYDLSLTPSARAWGDRNLVLSTPIMEYFAAAFLPGVEREKRRASDMSPLFANLRDLPPALFTVCTQDPLLVDTLFMEARGRAAGGRTALQVWPDAIHGFNAFPLAMSRAANAAQFAFLASSVV